MRNHTIAALLAVALLPACGPTIKYERDPTAPIAPGSAWAWGAPDNDGLSIEDGALVPDDSIARLLARTIETELAARGFRRTSPDSARFIVHFHVGQRFVTDTLPPRDDPVRTGVREPGMWGGYGRPEDLDDRTISWEEGMLIVDALTPDKRVVAWRGVIAGEIPADAGKDSEKAVRLAVRRLLRGLP